MRPREQQENERAFRAVLYSIIDSAGSGAPADEVVERYGPILSAMITTRVAEALDAQADFYWEASTLLDPARQVAEQNGEESMTAVLDAQIRTMREVSARIRRRAADWRGSDGPDPLAVVEPAAPVSLADSVTALADAWFEEHPEADRSSTTLEFRKGDDGLWKVAGGYGAGDACCACCATGTGKCYCHNSGQPKTKWCKCEACKEARKEGRLGDSA